MSDKKRAPGDESRIWTPANIVSLARVATFPMIMVLGYAEEWVSSLDTKRTMTFITALAFAVAFSTDFVDGWLARSRNEITRLGKLLDPLADKCVMVASLVILVYLNRCPAWVAILIIVREIAVSSLRSMAGAEGIIIAASAGGKLKTVTQAIAVGMLLWHYPQRVLGIPFDAHLVGTVVLYIALAITLWSGYDYFAKFITVRPASPAPKASAADAGEPRPGSSD